MRYNILKLFFEHLIVNIRNFSCNNVCAAERVTVNHDVAGSSPAGGAKNTPKIDVFGVFSSVKTKK